MLDFTNKAFNQVSFPIKMPVVFSARLSAITTFGNDDLSARSPDSLHKRLGIVTLVGNQTIKNNAVNQIIRLSVVALFAAGQDEPHRVAKCVASQMNFGRKAADGSP